MPMKAVKNLKSLILPCSVYPSTIDEMGEVANVIESVWITPLTVALTNFVERVSLVIPMVYRLQTKVAKFYLILTFEAQKMDKWATSSQREDIYHRYHCKSEGRAWVSKHCLGSASSEIEPHINCESIGGDWKSINCNRLTSWEMSSLVGTKVTRFLHRRICCSCQVSAQQSIIAISRGVNHTLTWDVG